MLGLEWIKQRIISWLLSRYVGRYLVYICDDTYISNTICFMVGYWSWNVSQNESCRDCSRAMSGGLYVIEMIQYRFVWMMIFIHKNRFVRMMICR